ncbi:hypothetical protein [Clostridium sp. D46t1_190503_E9]|nr:hypothetical protein [Clostridium sp. D46t1_190503_E9]
MINGIGTREELIIIHIILLYIDTAVRLIINSILVAKSSVT